MNKGSPRRQRPARIRRARWTMAIVASWLAVNACGPGGASPIPQPTVREGPRVVDLDSLSVSTPDPNGIAPRTIKGGAGSVPPNAVVRITDLNTTQPRFAGSAASDGSFSIEVPANGGDELRLEWVSDGMRSPPLDVILTDTSDGATLTLSPRFDCLSLNPGYVLQFSAAETQTLLFTSDCEQNITLSNARTRLSAPYFSVTTSLPLELSPTSSGGLNIAFTSTMANEQEDVLFLDVSKGSETRRYPITLGVP